MHSLDEHVPQIGELTVSLILNFNEAPLGLSSQNRLVASLVLLLTANHSKRKQSLKLRNYQTMHPHRGAATKPQFSNFHPHLRRLLE